MKTSIWIFCMVLSTLGLTAFGYINWNEAEIVQERTACQTVVDFESEFINLIGEPVKEDLIYKVDSRFMWTITKESLLQAKSIIDILPKKATQSERSYETVEVCMLLGDKNICEVGVSPNLNAAQLKLLQTAPYSTDFYVSATYKSLHPGCMALKSESTIYYMTIIPEKEAEYVHGDDNLIEYLRKNSLEETANITKDKLRPGQVNFTVNQKGNISNVKLSTTSGYPSVDKLLLELITQMPGKWNPATNSRGEKVDQELVFFFGLEGC